MITHKHDKHNLASKTLAATNYTQEHTPTKSEIAKQHWPTVAGVLCTRKYRYFDLMKRRLLTDEIGLTCPFPACAADPFASIDETFRVSPYIPPYDDHNCVIKCMSISLQHILFANVSVCPSVCCLSSFIETQTLSV